MSDVLLAVETSTEACSVALLAGGESRWRHQVAPREHARLVGSFIEELLADAGLERKAIDAIAFGRGPGSFTGVRIATSLVQGLALSLERPVIPVSTLAVLAQGGLRRNAGCTHALAAIDARMGQVYWGAFRRGSGGLAELLGKEAVLDPHAVRADEVTESDAVMGAGTGWGAHGEALAQTLGHAPRMVEEDALPEARDLLELALPRLQAGQVLDAAEAQPVYLRDNVASKPKPR
ncbi:MAG: tRNA (adenosine(37)-N6)-threonylcarbamoyltransferase complex dimerization subunit type 1 TsaB [Gammaproteobacteria bacterium]|nr:MAG: tRNA (adenosine(37)-N6)-threonylcarbamoyltransferase complex dimerization subunit type 1 TsaB [Gammaproteobacteria bacterium]